MSTYRIYVDSRDRRSGSATSFEYALPYSLAIQEKSLANIDVVVIPNSIQTVIEGVNDIIYMRERDNLGLSIDRTPKIAPGYYTIETLRVAIQDALNGPTKSIPGDYVVSFSERLVRFQFSHPGVRVGDSFWIYSKKDQLIPNVPAIPAIINNNGAWKLLGLESGNSVVVLTESMDPATAPEAPNLQYATQLFIKTDLGVTAQSVGPKGNMSISRRVVVDVPTFGLVVDRHSTSWDSFTIVPNTTISSFTVQLCDYNGNAVDLNGQNWSFSISIFREQL